MIEPLVVLLIMAMLLAAPVLVLVAWIAVIVLAFQALRFIVPLFLMLLVATALLGCAKAPIVSVQAAPIPGQLLECKPEPMPPATGSQRQVASYVLDLADAGDDCRQKLGAVKAIEASRRAS